MSRQWSAALFWGLSTLISMSYLYLVGFLAGPQYRPYVVIFIVASAATGSTAVAFMAHWFLRPNRSVLTWALSWCLMPLLALLWGLVIVTGFVLLLAVILGEGPSLSGSLLFVPILAVFGLLWSIISLPAMLYLRWRSRRSLQRKGTALPFPDAVHKLPEQRLPVEIPSNRQLSVGLGITMLLVVLLGVLLVSSSASRGQLRSTLWGMMLGVGLSSPPKPTFELFQFTYVPQGMQMILLGYNPGRGDAEPSSISASDIRSPQPGGMSFGWRLDVLDKATLETGWQRVIRLLGDGRQEMSLAAYAGGANRFLEVVMRPAAGRPLPQGDRVMVHSTVEAVFTRGEGHDILTWTARGTSIEIYSTIGRAEALRVANGLFPATPGAIIPIEVLPQDMSKASSS